jgi:hypothetical protein
MGIVRRPAICFSVSNASLSDVDSLPRDQRSQHHRHGVEHFPLHRHLGKDDITCVISMS